MDPLTDNGSAPGTNGPESILATDNGSNSEPVVIAGAINPDTARTVGDIGESGDDFTAAITDTDTGERTPTGRVKRTRGPNKRKDALEKSNVKIDGIEKILFSLHQFASAFVPEMELDKAEAKRLGDAIEGVTDQYKLTLDPKVAAYIDLATACGIIYGPRALAFHMRRKTEKKEAPKAADNVMVFTPAKPQTARPQPGFDPTKQEIFNG